MSTWRFAQFCAWGILFAFTNAAFSQENRSAPNGNGESFPAVCVFKKNASGQFVPPSAERIYQAHRKSAMLRVYDKNCNGVPDEDEVTTAFNDPDHANKLRRVAPALVVTQAAVPDDSPSAATAMAAMAKTPAAAAKLAKSNPSDMPAKQATLCPPGFSVYPIVRDSYADLTVVKITDCPPDLGKAKGATFSYTRDAVADNTQWAAQGVVAERFLWYRDAPCGGPCVSEIAFAPIARFQRLTNSNAKLVAKNLDVLSPGFSSEAFIEDPLHSPLQVYVRARANANGDFEGDTNSWSSTLEIQPVYGPLNIGTRIKIGNTFWYVAPVGRVQYFERTGKDIDPIFANSNHVFRAGPGVAVVMRPLDQDPVPTWLQNIALSASYDWFHDTVSRRDLQHFKTSLGYDITTNFGITLSYEKGKVEETGQDIATTMLSLSVKY